MVVDVKCRHLEEKSNWISHFLFIYLHIHTYNARNKHACMVSHPHNCAIVLNENHLFV